MMRPDFTKDRTKDKREACSHISDGHRITVRCRKRAEDLTS